MPHSTVLVVALGAMGLAPLFAVASVLLRDRPRRDIARTLATIGPGYVDRDRGASFGVRVGRPLARRLGRLGTALTPRGTVARLQRQLDRAGNPAGWPVERVVAGKGTGLAVGAAGGALFGLLLHGAGAVLLCGIAGAAVGFLGPDLI